MSTQTQDRHVVNGIDLEQLQALIQMMQADPTKGAFEFRARNQWQGGTHNRSEIGAFRGAGEEHGDRAYMIDCGEPRLLCGFEEGANPVEHLLNGLAGCLTTTMAAHAAARGIEIESIESELDGDLDIRGFLGIADDVTRGYREIRVKFKVKANGADAEQLRELTTFSPVYNTVVNPTPVRVEVEMV